MIIGIDASAIQYNTGVSNYTLNLIRNLIKIDKINQYKIFFSSYRQKLPKDIKALETNPNVTIHTYRYPVSFLEFIWNKLHLFPIEMFIGKCDIYHTSDWTQPPTIKAKTVTTVHDLVPFLYPEWSNKKIIDAHTRKMRLAQKKAKHFICVSKNTQKDLFRLFPKINPINTSVVYEAAEDKYGKSSALKNTVINKQYGLNKYFLCQGTREPRKNLARTIEAFSNFKNKYPKSNFELVISGKYGWGKDVLKFKRPDIKILGYIPEKNMVSLHASAFCLIYPSLYEGFGLPVIKSLKVGVPVITSSASSMSEIAGKAALYVNPKSVDSILKAMEKICRNSQLRKQLKTSGKKIANRFSWQKTAKATLNIYKAIC
jgi:glycosyltransferase involved in cell wall biosynthesis